MKILVACEFSGKVREAFRKLGHDAWSCDLLPADDHSPYHYECDVLGILDKGWDLMVAHPPCTHLAVSGARWFKYKQKEQAEALDFVQKLLDAPIERIALENPISVISSRIRRPDQIIQPWMFGEDASKSTCLWLKNLPSLTPTMLVEGRLYCCGLPLSEGLGMHGCPNCNGDKNAKRLYANQTPSGQNKLAPSKDRWKLRSETYQGIADAMASQWSKL